MEREPENVAFFARSLTPVPRSLLRNRTETDLLRRLIRCTVLAFEYIYIDTCAL